MQYYQKAERVSPFNLFGHMYRTRLVRLLVAGGTVFCFAIGFFAAAK